MTPTPEEKKMLSEKPEPFMFGIMCPDGTAYLDEICVDSNDSQTLIEVIEEQELEGHTVVALYSASTVEALTAELDRLLKRLDIGSHGEDAIDVLESSMGHLTAERDALLSRVERQDAARDLVADWIVEGTEDLPDDTPVIIKIGTRSLIFDELKNLRAALKETQP